MDVKDAIEQRRSRRALKPFSLDKRTVIEELSRAAMLAPSCYNKQPWQFVFVYEENKLGDVASTLMPGNEWVVKGGMVIALVSSPDRDCSVGDMQYYLFDCGLAVGQMMLRGTEMGIVVHPIAGFYEDKVKKVLGVPEEMRVPVLIAVGKAMADPDRADFLNEKQKETERKRPPRKPLAEFVFLNSYSNSIKD
ncbi:nitroreductase [Candidatus Woesearchaeota archaeon]|nr:MAG: nitroreductase [Candidatus Woesearchaeota archaeon]